MTNNKQCGICANCVPQIGGGSGFNNCEEVHAAQMAEGREMSNKLTNIQLAVKCEMERYRDLEKSGLKNVYPSRILFEAINRELAELQERRKAEGLYCLASLYEIDGVFTKDPTAIAYARGRKVQGYVELEVANRFYKGNKD
ncbi:hypothetical protein H3N91_003295 [Salmonella enterica]|nr:hypothetical protein [Salmonella enterica]EEA2271183.1 hypothetical protein [Salmonella enterica]EFV5117787.1 hypothetical protein [Salmonella enterica]EGB7058996.1 hypothetical protein [Salmonella enterica]EKL9524201.1 hypothetical protein [Salmonella enterica]